MIRDEFLWVEKYRPHTIKDCILPQHLKLTFQSIINQGDLQNLLLVGPAGVGKTTVIKALADQLGMDYIVINGSKDSGIDVLRTTISQFASTLSLEGKRKLIIIDEADYLNPNSMQPGLRADMEKFSVNCSFGFTANFKNKIIPPLHSRCSVIEFKIPKSERPVLAQEFLKRIEDILKIEKVEYDEKVLVELVGKFFPDFRRTLNELQRYSIGGKVDIGVLAQLNEVKIAELVKYLKSKDFGKMRKWVVEISDNDTSQLYRSIYDGLYTHFKDAQSIAQAVLILADYQYKDVFVIDKEINMVACLTQLMIDTEFK